VIQTFPARFRHLEWLDPDSDKNRPSGGAQENSDKTPQKPPKIVRIKTRKNPDLGVFRIRDLSGLLEPAARIARGAQQ
jgi:hypothetical protein